MQQVLNEAGCAEAFMLQEGAYRVSFGGKLISEDATQDDPFFHYYGSAWRRQLAETLVGPDGDRVRAQGLSRAMTDRGPRTLQVSTEDRLLWCKHLKPMLEALTGLPVYGVASKSWRWDRSNLRPNGLPTHIHVYEFTLHLNDLKDMPFNPATGMRVLGAVCEARHPLADKHLFEWQEDLIGHTLFNSYTWTPTGFVASFENKSLVEEAQELLFKGLDVQVTREPGRGPRGYLATVTLKDVD